MSKLCTVLYRCKEPVSAKYSALVQEVSAEEQAGVRQVLQAPGQQAGGLRHQADHERGEEGE